MMSEKEQKTFVPFTGISKKFSGGDFQKMELKNRKKIKI